MMVRADFDSPEKTGLYKLAVTGAEVACIAKAEARMLRRMRVFMTSAEIDQAMALRQRLAELIT
jgi:hypothetical protein